jgi:hypothetical protein
MPAIIPHSAAGLGEGVAIGVTITVSILSRRIRWMFANTATTAIVTITVIIARTAIDETFGASGTNKYPGASVRRKSEAPRHVLTPDATLRSRP